MMILNSPATQRVTNEAVIFGELLDFTGAHVIELGCGAAAMTRLIAKEGNPASILACEVDGIQHDKNLDLDVPSNIRFALAGAEDIPAENGCADIVIMFKSLHHVPEESLPKALSEIHRVLKPGGLAYFSEPVFDGDFNEVMRIFHDEEHARRTAFQALEVAVSSGQFELVCQRFFEVPRRFDSFEAFERRMINVTHTDHRLCAETIAQIRSKFLEYAAPYGGAELTAPMRVDLLRRMA